MVIKKNYAPTWYHLTAVHTISFDCAFVYLLWYSDWTSTAESLLVNFPLDYKTKLNASFCIEKQQRLWRDPPDTPHVCLHSMATLTRRISRVKIRGRWVVVENKVSSTATTVERWARILCLHRCCITGLCSRLPTLIRMNNEWLRARYGDALVSPVHVVLRQGDHFIFPHTHTHTHICFTKNNGRVFVTALNDCKHFFSTGKGSETRLIKRPNRDQTGSISSVLSRG